MRTIMVLVTVLLFAFSLVDPAFAVEKKRSAVGYPAYLVEESVKVVGDAGKGFVEAIGGTVEYAGQTLGGDTSKAGKIVTHPIEKSVKTTTKTIEATAAAPVKAGKDVRWQW
ncbi:MAG: hypothetical protein WBC00_07035 [Candidatus Omnitrophota bacterium]